MTVRSLILLVILLAVSIGLAATNPTKNEYKGFLESQLNQLLQQIDQNAQAGDPQFIRDLLKLHGQRVINSLVSSNTTRRNFGLFSIYETQALEVRVVVVGVGNNFYPVQGDQEIIRKVAQHAL